MSEIRSEQRARAVDTRRWRVRGVAAGFAIIAMIVAGAMGPAAAAEPSVDGPGLRGISGLVSAGAAVGWGDNFAGQVGDGTTIDRLTPKQVSGLSSGVVQMDANLFHTLAVRSNGTAWAWGANSWGQLGDGTQLDRHTPVPVSGLTGVTQVAAGVAHSLALRANGEVWAWGDNNFGQLGDGTTTDRHSAVQVAGLTNVVQIVAEFDHSLALRANGTVWGWGQNHFGQLGNADFSELHTPTVIPGLSAVAQIAAGGRHSLAVLSNRTVRAWGSNQFGQLGDGTMMDSTQPVPVPGLNDVVQVSAGNRHNLAARVDATVVAWGANSFGQLGDGTTTPHPTPAPVPGLTGVAQVATGHNHSLAAKVAGEVWAWGNNQFGGLGDGTTANRLVPTQVPNLAGVIKVAGGSDASFAVTQLPADFVILASPASGDLIAGGTVTTTVTITPKNGFSQPVNLAISGLPQGVSASFSPPSASVEVPSTLTLNASTLAFNGTAALTVTGTSGGPTAIVRTAGYHVNVMGGRDLGCIGTNHVDYPITDNGPAVTSSVVLVGCALARAPTIVPIDVHIVHPRRGDLVIDLISPDGVAHRVKDSDSSDTAADVNQAFVVDLRGTTSSLALNAVPPSSGDQWGLRVQDVATGVSGHFDSWTLTL